MPLAESLLVEPLLLDLSTLHLTDEQFYQLCLANPEQRLELTSAGVLIIMSPVGGESGSYELELGADLTIWNRRTELGKVFSSSTGFKLSLGGQRSPDAAWVKRSRWEALTSEQRRKFPPVAPDFLIELRSETDPLDKSIAHLNR
ncbi:MAG: Uma2 family endonuclease [Timaviella obliquedivisa GSE-PSE-MK23-08B]|jgi:Uma2 family endonuclease|nr:Uma2 family endonuclease [Timaviella obliquedivisa GSE-PSE-MK23-08B]